VGIALSMNKDPFSGAMSWMCKAKTLFGRSSHAPRSATCRLQSIGSVDAKSPMRSSSFVQAQQLRFAPE
jgi:hypothetical protein